MNSKQVRHAKIREMLQAANIRTHEEMAEALQWQQIEVSQSTLSKDLRELGVVRVPRPDGGFRYGLGNDVGATLRDQHILERELTDFLVEIDRADNIAVIKTVSGHAQSLCEALDRIGWQELMGTIAGENTIFALTRTAQQAEAVVARILAITGAGQGSR